MKYNIHISCLFLAIACLLVGVLPASTAPASANCQVTFVVNLPPGTPADARVFIAGSHPTLGDWQPGKIELARKGNQARGVFALPANSTIEYKFTLGGWERGELGDDGQDRPNRRLRVGPSATSETCTVSAFKQPGNDPTGGHTLTGTIVPHPQFASKHVTARDIWVYLPPDYHRTEARYPVLYLHDGNNCFDSATAFGGNEWRADETLERLIRAGTLPPIIAVAVANTAARMDDYTPVRDAQGRGGKADAYGRFLVEELKPFIDATYRTKADAANTGLLGSSLGGLVTMYFACKYPNVFTRLGVISPSVWWAERWIIKQVASSKPDPKSRRIWIDIGEREGDEDANNNGVLDAVDNARLLRDTLMRIGFGTRTLRYLEIPGAGHNEAAWASRLDKVLLFLFSEKP